MHVSCTNESDYKIIVLFRVAIAFKLTRLSVCAYSYNVFFLLNPFLFLL